jgi:hypothetical protein
LKQLLSRKAMIENTTKAIVGEQPRESVIKNIAAPVKEISDNNFLLLGAKKAKALRSARTAARVGCIVASSHTPSSTKQSTSTDHNRLSNTGSGLPLSQVVRLKYLKGFTQAVSMPCRLDDIS